MKKLAAASLAIVMMVCVSCASISLDTRSLSSPVSMNQAGDKSFTVIKSFEVNDKAGWILFVPANKPAGDNHEYISSILGQQILNAGGDAVINVKVRTQSQFLDYLTALIAPIYFTRTVTISGDVIKYD